VSEVTIVQRVLRFLGYLAIGLVIAILIGIIAWYFPSWTSRMWSGGWVWLAMFTPLIFWYPARQHRYLWGRLSFWITLSGLVALHLLAFTLLLRNYPVQPFWFAIIAIVEAGIIATILDAILPRPHRTHRRLNDS
jgi:hypothetical protein